MSKTIYTDEDARKAVRIHQQTGSATKAAEAIGCGLSSIYSFYDRLGIDRTQPAAYYHGQRIPLQEQGYPPTLVEEIVRQYDEERLGLPSLADLHDIQEATMHGWVEAAGVVRDLDEGQAARAVREGRLSPVYIRRKSVEMYLPPDPMPATEIADHFGCCHTAITFHLEKAGVLRNRREKQIIRYHDGEEGYARTVRRAARMHHEEGMTYAEISDVFGVNRKTVGHWLATDYNPYRSEETSDRTWWLAA